MSAKPDPATLPCSPLDETTGLKYFPRMLGKIRLHAEGKLWEDLHANLGKGSDGALVDFLHINYDVLKARVLQGGSATFRECCFCDNAEQGIEAGDDKSMLLASSCDVQSALFADKPVNGTRNEARDCTTPLPLH